MATGCGFTPAQVREMTLPDYHRIMRYWRQHPPAHMLLAGIAKWKPPAKTTGPANDTKPSASFEERRKQNEGNLAALIAMAKGKTIRVEDIC